MSLQAVTKTETWLKRSDSGIDFKPDLAKKKPNMRLITLMIACLMTVAVNAQEAEGVKPEGAHEAEYNSDAQDRDHSGEIDSRVQPSEDSEGGDFERESHDPDQAANTSGVTHRTVSSSGSPAILMTEEVPDGTNTMQRATLNTAGSPVPGRGAGQMSQHTEGDVRSENRKSDGELHKEIPGPTFVSDREAKSQKKNSKKKKK